MGILDALFNPTASSPQDVNQAGLMSALLGAAGGALSTTGATRLPQGNGAPFAAAIGGGFQGLGNYNKNRFLNTQTADEQQQILTRELANRMALGKYNMLASYMGWPGMAGQEGASPGVPQGAPSAAPTPPPAADPGGYRAAATTLGVPYSSGQAPGASPAAPAFSGPSISGLPDMRPAIIGDMLVPGSGKTILDKTMPGPSALAALYAERNRIAAQNPADPRLPEYDNLIAKTSGDPGYLARSTAATEAAKFPYAATESYLRYAGRPQTVGNAVLPGYAFLPPNLQKVLGVGPNVQGASPAPNPAMASSANTTSAANAGSGVGPPYSGLTKLPGGGYANTQRDTRLAGLDSEMLKDMNTTAEKAHQSQMSTREGLDLLNNFQTGKLGDRKLALMQWAKSLGVDQDTINNITGIKGDNTAAGEALNKIFLQITASAVRVMGAREPGSVISMFKSAYPSLDVRPETAKLMLNLIDQQYQRDIDRVQEAGKFLKNNPNAYLSTDFDEYFNQKHPIESYLQTAYKKAGMTQGDLNQLQSSSAVNPVGEVTEGATATNPKTGARIIFRGGQWQPLQ